MRGSGEIDVYVITGSAQEEPVSAKVPVPARRRWRDYGISVAVVAACSVVAALLAERFALSNLIMVYLLGVVLVAFRSDPGPSILASILSVAAFDFFFVTPYYTFAVSDIRYVVTFIVMFVVSFVISRLTLRVRQQAEAARLRERRTAALYNLSRDLVRERGAKRLSEIAMKHIGEVFDSRVAVLIPDEQNRLSAADGGPSAFAPDQQELSVAQWVYEHRQPAGLGSDTLPGAKALYLPLIASAGVVGVMLFPLVARAFGLLAAIVGILGSSQPETLPSLTSWISFLLLSTVLLRFSRANSICRG